MGTISFMLMLLLLLVVVWLGYLLLLWVQEQREIAKNLNSWPEKQELYKTLDEIYEEQKEKGDYFPVLITYGLSLKKDNCDNQCAVCLDDYMEGMSCWILPQCKHFFHVACINQWLIDHGTCPMCRSPVPLTL